MIVNPQQEYTEERYTDACGRYAKVLAAQADANIVWLKAQCEIDRLRGECTVLEDYFKSYFGYQAKHG
jgi:hypothetical protein